MKTPKKAIQFNLLKPLAVSVSSCLLFACASTGSNTSQQPTVQGGVPKVSASTTPDVFGNDAYAGILDQATLDELEDLLQATDMSMVEGDKLTVQRYGNLWDRVRRGYRMNHISNSRIEAQKSWFYRRQDYINRLTARTSRYLYHTVTEAERRGIPTELALLPIIESSYDPSATSNAAAAGLWQFIPSTGRIYGLNQSTTYDGRRDVIESTRAAYDFLTSLYNQFGSWELALAAYNAGPGRIQRAINANRAAGLPTDYWSLRLPTETMNYVPRFMAVAQVIATPSSYGVDLPAIANHNHFRAVPANYGVSLYDVSNITGVPLDELRLLNPALINFNVDSSGPGRIVIPNSVAASADKQLGGLRGLGYGATSYTASSFVAPKSITPTAQSTTSARELASANALPTTSVQITAKNTIIQEPPLSVEERDFIAAQIQANSTENVKPISDDGNIDLTAVQTAQSILEARGEVKSLSFNAPATTETSTASTTTTAVNTPVTTATTPATTNVQAEASKPVQATTPVQTTPATVTQPAAKPERYKVVAGDTLSGIAAKHGLSLSQIASYNGIATNTQVKTGQRLWLIPGKVSTVANAPATPAATTAKTTTHTVQAGESLTAIARKYNTTVQDVAALNGLSVTDGVLINQKLKVPAGIKAPTAPVATVKAEPKANTQMATYTIQSGDSLTSVAAKYGITVAELATANNMSTDAGLIRGKTLNIPASGTVKPTAKASTPSKTTTQTQTPAPAKPTIKTQKYTIQSGDTLTGVANKHGMTVAQLAELNNMAVNAGLVQGRTLLVPESKATTAQTKTTASTAKSNATQPAVAKGNVFKSTENYTVQSGDSLNALARKYGVSVADLAATNNMATNAGLKRGQVIKVPKLTDTYTVKSGDNLNNVARRYGISASELAKMNNLDTNAGLKIGQKITVPAK